jgi:ABC-type sugar transport system permease subunit
MAEPEVEAASRAEFKQVGEAQFRDSLNRGLFEEPKRQKKFRWWGDEGEARRLRDEQTYHYVRWTFVAAVAAVVVSLIVFGLTFLH